MGAAAGVSRTAPYRHFADKEELLAAVAARALHTLGAEMLRSRDAAGDDPRARLEAAKGTDDPRELVRLLLRLIGC